MVPDTFFPHPETEEPVVITLRKDGSLRLLATNGAIYGKEIRFEQPFRNIGYWHGENDHVVWQIRLPKSGRYEVYLDYACHPDSAGNRFVLDTRPSVRGQVTSTGGWDRYRRVKIGTITLRSGMHTLAFRPDGKMTRRALLDLRGLLLAPIAQTTNSSAASESLAIGTPGRNCNYRSARQIARSSRIRVCEKARIDVGH